MIADELSSVLEIISGRTHYFDNDLNDVDLTDVNQKDWAGDYPLHIAAMLGGVKEIDVLIKNGAIVNAMGEKKLTPLHYAAMKNHIDVARMLIRSGADPHLQDSEGRKPSQWARTAGHVEMTSLLVEAEKSN